MGREIKVTIKKGKVSIETSGFEGPTCLAATQRLEDVLGGKELDRTEKDEMFKEPASTDVTAGNA